MGRRRQIGVLLVLAAGISPAVAATPPTRISYQGVLRNPAGTALAGSFDMTFRLWSASSGGDEIFLDRHLAAAGLAVPVTGGLFTVEIGAGSVHDGAGPGTFLTLGDVFRQVGDVWLEVQVGSEVLAPRTRLASAAYAMNATTLEGRSSTEFLDTTATAQVKTGRVTFNNSGNADFGVWGRGGLGGGVFEADDGSSAVVGKASYGIDARGTSRGGTFATLTGSGQVDLALPDVGIQAFGAQWAGVFLDTDSSGEAYLGIGDYGMQAFGSSAGAYIADLDHSGVSYVGYGDRGIWAKGNFAGGTFSHPDNVTYWADVSTPTRKIVGTGTVSFVQNHPYEKDKVVVYAAPEGDEVAVYTRGTARLAGGVARVDLEPSFAWVANPDLGLTAHLTPRSDASLYVESVSSRTLVVRARSGSDPDAAFDYLVYGLRLGFEDLPPVLPKEREAFLPPAGAVEGTHAGHPELRRFSAMERFKEMRAALGETAPLDLSRSRELAAAVDADRPATVSVAPARPPSDAPPPSVVRETVALGSLSRVSVAESVRLGDVLAIDPAQPGALRRSTTAPDPGVAGCVAEIPEGTTLPPGEALLATSGVVFCRVDASFGAIAPGDLLTTSPNPGHAARADDAAPGAVLGKAMEAWTSGTGLIRVLVR